MLAPKKWNRKNNNLYRGYFPNDVNGKEGLDIGDLKVTKTYSKKVKNKYIEFIDLNKCFKKKSIKILSDYFDNIFNLSELLFKGIIKLYDKNPCISSEVFSRYKTLSTLRFNFYPKQDFIMNKSFLNENYNPKNGVMYKTFLNKSLKKFVEYQR